MTDTVTPQTILDGERNVVIKLHIVADGTPASNVVAVDVSALAPAPSEVRIMAITSNLSGIAADLHWDASTNVDIITLSDGDSFQDFKPFGGLYNNAGAGKTGDILLSTRGSTAADEGTIILELKKK